MRTRRNLSVGAGEKDSHEAVALPRTAGVDGSKPPRTFFILPYVVIAAIIIMALAVALALAS